MSWFGSPQAKPYIVTVDVDGTRHEEAVMAYDSMEAVMAASFRLSGRGLKDTKVLDVRPDEAALKARYLQEYRLMRQLGKED